MPELDAADVEGMGRADTILVCVPPPDGPAIAAALRERGFSVSEAPLHALAARLSAEAPRALIADVDPPGAVEAIMRAREGAAVELLCVGDPERAAELGVARMEGRAFARPVDVEALALAVLAAAEPGPVPRSHGTVPPGYTSRESLPPLQRFDSDAPASEYPSTSDPLEVAAILPMLEEGEPAGPVRPVEMSPALAQILEGAEQRVSAQESLHPSDAPSSPEEDVDIILPPEILSWLADPLDADEASTGGSASASSASTGGMGYPHPVPTGDGTPPGTGARPDTAEGTRAGRPTGAPTGVARTPTSTPPPTDAAIAPKLPRAPATPVRVGVVPIPIEPSPGPEAGYAAKSPGMAERAPLSEPEPPTSLMGAHSLPAMALPVKQPAPQPPPPRTFEPSPLANDSLLAPPSLPGGAAPPALPAVLGEGDAARAVATAIAARVSGSIALGTEAATRRIVLHDGDIVTAASGAVDETLVAFLAARGDLERDVAARLAGKVPAHGRHAGAALVAHGHLGQDDLWPVLRAYAEWIIGRTLLCDEGTCQLEAEPPGRLKAEPNVFGGATGAEVLLEQIRRVVPPELCLRRLGGQGARLAEGPRRQLLAECALRPEDEQVVRSSAGQRVGEVLAGAEPELADVLYGLVCLGVLDALAPAGPAEAARPGPDPLDEEALRQRVRARVALVEDGDYFSLLGIARNATGYEIRRAYLELRRTFEPGRVLTAATADLADDVRLVVEVLDEAYEILREPHRRDRYRRAIEAGPP